MAPRPETHARPGLLLGPLLGLLVLMGGLSGCGDEAPAPEDGTAERALPRHVLLVSVDTLRPDRLGCYGGPRPISPNVDRLAAEGVRFEKAMAPIPQTSPSHGSLFTGLYPLRLGLTSNQNRMRLEPVTLAEILQDHGFATGAFFHLFPFEEAQVTQGFETTFLDDSPTAAGIESELAGFVDAHPGQPLFTWVHYYLPHAPLDPPAAFDSLIEHPYDGPLTHEFRVLYGLAAGLLQAPPAFYDHYRDQYDAEVAHTDQHLGRVLELFRSRDLLDDTLVVFTADHGERLEDGIVGLHAPYLLETTLSVPLILAGPGLPEGGTQDAVVELLDVFATVLDSLDLAVPGGVDAHSLLPLARGERPPWDGRAFSILPSEYMGRVAPGGAATAAAAVAVRDEHHLLIRNSEGRVSLRDLRRPYPQRTVDPAAESARIQAMGQALDTWLRSLPLGSAGGEVDADTRRLLGELGYEVD